MRVHSKSLGRRRRFHFCFCGKTPVLSTVSSVFVETTWSVLELSLLDLFTVILLSLLLSLLLSPLRLVSAIRSALVAVLDHLRPTLLHAQPLENELSSFLPASGLAALDDARSTLAAFLLRSRSFFKVICTGVRSNGVFQRGVLGGKPLIPLLECRHLRQFT